MGKEPSINDRVMLLYFETESVSDETLAEIRAIVPEVQVLVTHDREKVESVLDRVEITVGHFPPELVSQAPGLRWMQQWGAGMDWLLRHPEAVDLDFVLTNASGVHVIPISEHIMALLLALARQLHHAVRGQDRHDWKSPKRDCVFELAGKTMLLLGVGAIGRRTAVIASGMGIRVIGVDREPTFGASFVEAIYGPEKLLGLLPEADFVVLTIPLTHQTRGIIGENELRAMKSTAHIINIGRGGTIQQDVLIRALKEGWIAGAGLDVFEEEPLPEDSPLWDMENVIITCHYAGSTPHYNDRAMTIFLNNLRRYAAGEPLRNVVDKKLGY